MHYYSKHMILWRRSIKQDFQFISWLLRFSEKNIMNIFDKFICFKICILENSNWPVFAFLLILHLFLCHVKSMINAMTFTTKINVTHSVVPVLIFLLHTEVQYSKCRSSSLNSLFSSTAIGHQVTFCFSNPMELMHVEYVWPL